MIGEKSGRITLLNQIISKAMMKNIKGSLYTKLEVGIKVRVVGGRRIGVSRGTHPNIAGVGIIIKRARDRNKPCEPHRAVILASRLIKENEMLFSCYL
jgi:hypothetical protein